MATSDTLSRHMRHDCLARPEAQMTARRNEFCTSLRSFQRDAPVVAAVRHASLPEEWQRCLSIADEFAGYPLQAGHCVTSVTERHLMFSLPRPRQGLDVGYNGCKQIRQCPPKKSRGWCCAVSRSTIEVMQYRPSLVPVLGQAPLMMRPLREGTVAALHS